MAFDVTKLPDYTNQDSTEFITKSILGASTLSILAQSGKLLTNVKGKQAIPISDVDVVLQDNSTDAGERNAQGGMVIDQVIIEPAEIKSLTNWSNRQLTDKFTVEELKAKFKGQNYDNAAFAEFIGNEQAAAIASINEQALWQGDVNLPGTGATKNLNRFDGFLKKMKVSGATGVAINLSGSTTGATIVDKLKNGFLATKVEVRTQPDFRLFISKADYQLYIAALSEKNLYVPATEKVLFGTDCPMEIVEGLVGTGTVVFTRLRSLYAGTDMDSDASTATKYFSPETKQLYIDFQYSLGTATAMHNEIFYSKVA
ncbi:hypothetical protein [Mucilaginibacter defluvii]|uniref:Phage major capsid protein n=1 Tax=Mucilaginibacter defluvii TaxID=1196019 RepID=A0ABP9FL41_9SPHI